MQRYRLKTKFMFITSLISLLIGTVALFAFSSSSKQIISDLAQNFGKKEALLEKNKIVAIIDREVALALKMADDVSIKRWVADENNPVEKQLAFEELESYRKLFRDNSFFIALKSTNHYYVYNKAKGNERIDLFSLEVGNADDKWFFDGIENIDGYALNLDYNPNLQEAKVWFNAIMFSAQGERLGICGGGINISDFLNELVYSGEKGFSTILIDQSGIIQGHEDRTIVEHNAKTRKAEEKITLFNLLDDPSAQEQFRAAIVSLVSGNSEVEAFPVRLDGKDYLLATSYMPGIGWLNVVLVDVASVLSMKAFLPIVIIMAVALLLAIILIGLLINRWILVPLGILYAASDEVAKGQYDVVLPVTGHDELSDLTGSFNTMTATILDYTKNLETMVQERTDELSSANRLLEDSQQKITESIRYARTIQTSILPSREALQSCLGEHFILYRPKEQVGGDFYYLRAFPEHFLLAIIDCTGHGIPGAFMTMTVNSVLNHVIDVFCQDNPARILAELNRVMRSTLKMREVDAGLDIGLCMVNRSGKELIYAGAGMALYVVAAGDVQEVRGDHQRIGYKGSKLDYRYNNQRLTLTTGDSCYLTSDGVLDEAGGEKGYGFGGPRFKEMLREHSHLSLQAQQQVFEDILREYRGTYRQRDDMTFIGFHF